MLQLKAPLACLISGYINACNIKLFVMVVLHAKQG